MQERAMLTQARREIRRIQREARGLWTRVRLHEKLYSYTDLSALRSLDRAIERAYPNIDPRDFHAALVKHAADPKTGSPWYADEWIHQARDDRTRSSFADLDLDAQEAALRAAR